ncbi:MAG: TerB family tellurite resistance protein [Anaerolineae bacterium]|nr:TerB family tellurite resistance protein [Anaerolineae bacterium]
MPDKNLVMTLAKVLIAAAWVDGEITEDEANSAKDLLFYLPQTTGMRDMKLTAQEFSLLEMYVDTPVDEAERARLVADLQDAIKSSEDKAFVVSMLQQLLAADGEVTAEETAVLTEIETAVDEVHTGTFSSLSNLFGGAVKRRSEVANAPNRELYFEDFIKNRIFYFVEQRLNGQAIGFDEADLRKYSLAGGLMAKVAETDNQVTDAEFAAMASALEDKWGVERETAVFITEVAVAEITAAQDVFRMYREFSTMTTEDERVRFVEALFAVAAADGDVSFEETEEIRTISRGLNLYHHQFIEAKLKVIS